MFSVQKVPKKFVNRLSEFSMSCNLLIFKFRILLKTNPSLLHFLAYEPILIALQAAMLNKSLMRLFHVALFLKQHNSDQTPSINHILSQPGVVWTDNEIKVVFASHSFDIYAVDYLKKIWTPSSALPGTNVK